MQSDKLKLLRRIPDIRFQEEENGYSKDQVDRVLANLAPLANEINKLELKLKQAEDRAVEAEARLVEARAPSGDGAPPVPQTPTPDFDETLRNTLVSAQRQADTTVREANEEAERLRTEAEFQSNNLLNDARAQADELTAEAVTHRDQLMAEAAEERAKLLSDAQAEAKEKVTAVETELSEAHEQERDKLVTQITELQDRHKLLQGDVKRFEDHIAERCEQVRSAVEDIGRALDDPESLRPVDVPEPATIEEVDVEAYPPVGVQLDSLDELNADVVAANEQIVRDDPIDAADVIEQDFAESTTDLPDPTADMAPPFQEEADPEELAQVASEALDVADGAHADIDDSQLGVVTQTVPMGGWMPDQPETLDQNGGIVTLDPDQNAASSGDPFLDELKRVTTEEPSENDPITDFFDEQQENAKGGWFGRRK